MSGLLVNGRFLRVRPTGMQRAARTLCGALRAAGVAVTVAEPGRSGRVAGLLWEQAVLPALAGERPIVSPVNLAPLAARRSVVWTHDLAPVLGPQWFRSREVAAYARLLLASARRAETVYVPSRQVAAEVAEHGVDPAKVRLLRTPLDPAWRPQPPEAVTALRARLGLDRPYVVLLGCHDPRKDAAFAGRVHAAARPHRDHDLVLAGRPHPIFAPVRLPAGESVRVLGYLPDDDLPALLGGAAALLSPSRYEGFGLPPAEAIACGTPALVSDLPAHRESTAGTATYLPVGDLDAWVEALLRALDGGLAVGALPAWTAADMAAQFVAGLPDDLRADVSRVAT